MLGKEGQSVPSLASSQHARNAQDLSLHLLLFLQAVGYVSKNELNSRRLLLELYMCAAEQSVLFHACLVEWVIQFLVRL